MGHVRACLPSSRQWAGALTSPLAHAGEAATATAFGSRFRSGQLLAATALNRLAGLRLGYVPTRRLPAGFLPYSGRHVLAWRHY